MKKDGATLVELLVVVIVIAILASLASAQYDKFVEKTRGQEAFGAIQQMDAAERTYYLNYQQYLIGTGDALLQGLGILPPRQYWGYSVIANPTPQSGYKMIATRLGNGPTAGQTIEMTHDGVQSGTWDYLCLIIKTSRIGSRGARKK
jgi:type IV pilus assembly protein PilE